LYVLHVPDAAGQMLEWAIPITTFMAFSPSVSLW